MKLITVQRQLEEANLKIFTPLEFQRLFGVKPNTSQKFLERNARQGYFVRLKRGLYAFKELTPFPFQVANQLYYPSYISFESALSFYQLIPETVYSITSATTKPSREFHALGQHFTYTTLKKSAYQGYEPRQQNEATIIIAEPEKALADMLYLVNLGKRRLPGRVDLKKINQAKLKQFLKVFQRAGLKKTFDDFQKVN